MTSIPETPSARGGAELAAAPPRAVRPAGEELTEAEVAPLLSGLVKALRAHQMYQANNPVYQKFVGALQQYFSHLWTLTSALYLAVEEDGLRWEDHFFPAGEGRETLAFQLYKDGIRTITFLPGFEEEVDAFLETLHQARLSREDSDDLITLLWTRDFAAFQYGFVDMLADGASLPEAGGLSFSPIPREELARELAEAAAPAQPGASAATATASPAKPAGLSREDFQETLYFLDDNELAQLQKEVQAEWARDVKHDVLTALLDRLADPLPERQLEILRILRQMLASSLAQGDMRSAAMVVRDLDALAGQPGVLADASRELVTRLLEELGEPESLGQLIQLLESGDIAPDAEDLSLFFRQLRSGALPLLIRAADTTASSAVRERLHAATDQLARGNSDALVELLDSPDPVLAAGAATLIGRHKLAGAAPRLGALLRRPEPRVRLAATEAILAAPSGAAMEPLMGALEDEERDVRVTAARGIGAMRYRPARQRLEALLQGRILRDSDLTEKISFFEAYALVAAADAVPLLDRVLNGRGLLGRRPAAEIRACAALALGKVGTPAARTSLTAAAADPEPVVKNAVGRALRTEGAS